MVPKRTNEWYDRAWLIAKVTVIPALVIFVISGACGFVARIWYLIEPTPWKEERRRLNSPFRRRRRSKTTIKDVLLLILLSPVIIVFVILYWCLEGWQKEVKEK